MRHVLLIVSGLFAVLNGAAQLSVGTGETLFMQNGVTFYVDSLVLIPSANNTISNTVLTHSYTPATGAVPGTNSIARVYSFSNPITYTGELGIIYNTTELAGNTEGLLQIAYKMGTTWTTTAASSVNTTTHYVSYPSPGIAFSVATATTAGVALPIVYNGFTASLKAQYVLLNWQMGDIDDLAGFTVEYSNDGRVWSVAGTVEASPSQRDFTFYHNDLNFSLRYYRLAAKDHSGRSNYSKIVAVRNGDASNGLHVVRNVKSVMLYFSGQVPSTVQVYDMKGQLVATKAVNQQQCEITGLTTGIYVIHYTFDGVKVARRVQF